MQDVLATQGFRRYNAALTTKRAGTNRPFFWSFAFGLLPETAETVVFIFLELIEPRGIAANR